MGSWRRLLVVGVCSWCFAGWIAAQKPPAPPEHGLVIPLAGIPRVTKAPKLEEFLNAQPREAELAVDTFRQYIPGDGSPATEKTTKFTTDVLFTYLLHPGTALYVGSNNGLSNLSLDNQSLPTPSVLYQSSPTNRTSQLFFVKLSYLFRF